MISYFFDRARTRLSASVKSFKDTGWGFGRVVGFGLGFVILSVCIVMETKLLCFSEIVISANNYSKLSPMCNPKIVIVSNIPPDRKQCFMSIDRIKQGFRESESCIRNIKLNLIMSGWAYYKFAGTGISNPK